MKRNKHPMIKFDRIVKAIFSETTITLPKSMICFEDKKSENSYFFFIPYNEGETTTRIDKALFDWIKNPPFLLEKAQCITSIDVIRKEYSCDNDFKFYYTFHIQLSRENQKTIDYLDRVFSANSDQDLFSVVEESKKKADKNLKIFENPDVLLKMVAIYITRQSKIKNKRKRDKAREKSKNYLKKLCHKRNISEITSVRNSRLSRWLGLFNCLEDKSQHRLARKLLTYAWEQHSVSDIDIYMMYYRLLKDHHKANHFLVTSINRLLASDELTRQEKLEIIKEKRQQLLGDKYFDGTALLDNYINDSKRMPRLPSLKPTKTSRKSAKPAEHVPHQKPQTDKNKRRKTKVIEQLTSYLETTKILRDNYLKLTEVLEKKPKHTPTLETIPTITQNLTIMHEKFATILRNCQKILDHPPLSFLQQDRDFLLAVLKVTFAIMRCLTVHNKIYNMIIDISGTLKQFKPTCEKQIKQNLVLIFRTNQLNFKLSALTQSLNDDKEIASILTRSLLLNQSYAIQNGHGKQLLEQQKQHSKQFLEHTKNIKNIFLQSGYTPSGKGAIRDAAYNLALQAELVNRKEILPSKTEETGNEILSM